MSKLPLNPMPIELEIDFIFRHRDLHADWEKLEALRKGVTVKEFERFNLSPNRIRDILEELDALRPRMIHTMHPDVVDVFFSKRQVQIADITLMSNDPLHMFKTKVYKRIMEEMLPGYKVIAFDIKPLDNGTYQFFRVD